MLPAQLGDLEKAVAAGEVPFCHRDLLGEAPRALREGLHDPRNSKASAVSLVRILAGSEPRHLRPRLLGELAIARKAGVPEQLGVAGDGLVEHVPGAIELPREEALGERHGVWPRAATGVAVQIFEARDHVGHLAAGVVDVFKRAFGDLERVLGELDDVATAPLLKQSLEQVDRLLDAADVAPNLAIGDEVAIRKGPLDQRT